MTVTAADLESACHDAFREHPNACNFSTLAVMAAIGKLSGTIISPPHSLTADALVDWLASPASAWSSLKSRKEPWTASQLAKIATLANGGCVVVVGGLGHVCVVYPGGMKESGGYPMPNHGGAIAPSHGKYPRCMSTSIGTNFNGGPWPGAMSDGEKTIFDPWGADTFPSLGCWVQPGVAEE